MAKTGIVFLLAATAFGQVKQHIPRMEKVLKENILGFWLPKTLDSVNGGYTMNHGPDGEAKGPGTKMIVTQSRQVWLFSRAARENFGDRKQLLDAADHGYRFLRDKMWDQTNGGFYWEVDATGKPLRAAKHMYGESFGLYALSEYYRASGKKEVLELATRLFDLIEAKSHDKEFGGYIEDFEPDWTPRQGPEPSPMGPPDLKLMNTHLHLLESMTAYYLASHSPLARERLLELISIQTNAVVRKGLTACTDKYDRNWTPRLEGPYARVSYGHDIENVWLIVDACKAAEVPVWPYVDLLKDLWDYSLRYGYDSVNGGFWYTGAFSKPADDFEKSWWVQAESLVSALYMYGLTADRKYLDVFEKTWSFIDHYQIDWDKGEWWPVVGKDLKGHGDKADIWKGGYHDGRAMMECIRVLREMK